MNEWKEQQKSSLNEALQYKDRDKWKQLWLDHLTYFFQVNNEFGNCTVVDVGCGPVGILSAIKARRKIGVDPLINEYQRIFGKLEPDVKYYNAKGEALPLSDDLADVVFCVNTLNHVEQPLKVLSEIARVLKSIGTFYFDVHNNLLSPAHPHVFTKHQIEEMLSRFFEVERMIEWHEIPSISIKRGFYISKTTVWGAVCFSLKP